MYSFSLHVENKPIFACHPIKGKLANSLGLDQNAASDQGLHFAFSTCISIKHATNKK